MNCHRHAALAAVGICKWCCKGVCADCARDREGGLSCCEDCEQQVASIARLVRLSRTSAVEHGKLVVGLLVTVGLAFTVFGGLALADGDRMLGAILLVPGLIFLSFGARRWRAKRGDEADS